MSKFLIEVPHPEETVACARVVDVFLKTGSHYLTGADWGCKDGVHKSWMLVEVDGKEDALRIVPPAFREHAKVVQLNSFSMKEIDGILKKHEA
jgi:hypothetical protein